MTNKEQIQKVIDYLNSAFAADPDAMHAMIAMNRVPCNQAMADHPDVVVGKNFITGGWTVGTLGLINGALTSMGLPRVAIKWSDTKDENGRYQFLGFCEYNPEKPSSQS
jgi:hypothetical protein